MKVQLAEILRMSGSQKKIKRPGPTTKHVNMKRSAGGKLLSSLSRMDVSFPDDSNDSGLGTEVLNQITKSRDSLLLDDFDNSSCDDKDSSNDSIDSGIFALSNSEETCSLMETLPSVDLGSNLLEDSGLAHLLCQTVITEEIISPNELEGEPPKKRSCTVSSPSVKQVSVVTLKNNSNSEPLQINANRSQIQLLGIASENERPHVTPSKSSNNSVNSHTHCGPHSSRKKGNRKLPSLHVSYPNHIKDGEIELRILSQPEEQHRARYMTEGSRGAVKDRIGTGFPTVKLYGYNQPVTLQVFIGTDQGKVQPHLFYQACKVSGKNCTPCTERVIDGTAVIEISMLPDKDMTVSCDCIGILKERNVDVEQRLPYFSMTRAKKKNTRCRMVFRVHIPTSDITVETLQAASCPILCTQPPGIPEISKKSLKECSLYGGKELFIIGKNFLKDTKVIFQEHGADDVENNKNAWQEVVEPEKEFLHQTHLVCRVPPYHDQGVAEPLKVQLVVQSGGKTSEPHTFTYLPVQQGNPVANSGKMQQLSQNHAGNMEMGSPFSCRSILPTIIQIPTAAANGMTAVVLAQQNAGLVTVSGRHAGNQLQPNANKLSKHFSKVSTKILPRGEGGQNPLLMIQNDKMNKRISFPHQQSSLNALRHRNCSYIGKRISNRYYHSRGKQSHGKLTELRARSQASRQAVHNLNNSSNEQHVLEVPPVQIFKQECDAEITEEQLYNNIASNVGIANPLNPSFFSSSIKTSPSESSSMDQTSLFESQVVPTTLSTSIEKSNDGSFINPSVMSESVSGLVELKQSQLYSTEEPSQHMQVSPITSNLMAHATSQAEILTEAQQTLSENQANLLILPQDANDIPVQLSQVLSSDEMPALQTASLTTAMLTSQLSSPLANELSPNHLHQSELLSPTLSNQTPVVNLVVSQSLPVDHLGENSIVTQSLGVVTQSSPVQEGCICPSNMLSPSSFTCPIVEQQLQESSLNAVNVQTDKLSTAEILSASQIEHHSPVLTVMESKDLSQPEHMIIATSSLEPRTTLTAADCSASMMCESGSSLTTQRLPLGSDPMLAQDAMKTAISSQLGSGINSKLSTEPPQSLLAIATLPTSVAATESSIVQTSSIITDPKESQVQLQSTIQGGAVLHLTPNPISQGAAIMLSSGKMSDVKQEKAGDQCEMTMFQHCMTTALSQLSEADLLQIINPSTFDNVCM